MNLFERRRLGCLLLAITGVISVLGLHFLLGVWRVGPRKYGEYEFVRLASDHHAIVDSDAAEVIPSNITRLGYRGGILYGYIEPRAYLVWDSRECDMTTRGYFILDVRTGERHIGMSETDWRLYLNARGIQEPRLKLAY